ncbi:TetR/AcrR family transcriptional regulator [Nocardioides panacisoli]|uniref:TetR/AcrR family transcriptional regulator n=1 Tax=Nocardioides panacisoli TaxID=627624 RepID=A0ABP7IJS8_9ACTN
MATAKTPADAWLDAGLTALAEGGPEAVRVERLATALGVTKGGFYWHFPDRTAFLERVLDRWEHAAVEDVIAILESHPADARDRLRELFGLAMSFVVSREGAGVELAVRDWARRDTAVAARLRGIDDRRMSYMRALFAEFCDDELDVEARCLLAYSVFLGQHLVAATHGDYARADVLHRALENLLT